MASLLGKRRSEQATSLTRKRQRTELAEPLRTEAKTLAHGLLEDLTIILELLSDNDSTESDRKKIKDLQITCRAILNDKPIYQTMVDIFEINPETHFLLAHADQGNICHWSSHALLLAQRFSFLERRDMYQLYRKYVIQNALLLQEAVVKYIEENEKQQEYGDLPSNALSNILC